MVDREKSKQACSSGYLSRRLKEDRISQLPDPLICHILSHLPTKDSVKTSVLSTRWRTLWLWLPRLELDSTKLPDLSAFMSLGDRFFDSNRVSYIRKLKLTITHTSFVDGVDDNVSVFTSWIDAAVKRKVQRLHVHFPCLDVMMPLSLSTCETLVSLKLHMVALPYTESVSLPCLKTMRLTSVWFPDEATFERLVSSCLVLEELEIEGEISSKMDVFRVFSKSLKKLTTSIYFSLRRSGSGIVIDAPRLSFFSIYDYLSEKVLITNMDSNVTLDIHLGYGLLFNEREALSERNRLRSFLPKISKVRDMIIHRDTFKLLFKCSKLEPLPQFGYMSRLHVAFYYSLWKWLPTLLESFPNLKSLIMVCYDDNGIMHFEEMNHIIFSHPPRCLLSSLEFVDIIVRTSEHVAEMKLARYFLENSAILKKLTLHLDSDSTTEDEILKKLLEIPRTSTKCEVFIVKK